MDSPVTIREDSLNEDPPNEDLLGSIFDETQFFEDVQEIIPDSFPPDELENTQRSAQVTEGSMWDRLLNAFDGRDNIGAPEEERIHSTPLAGTPRAGAEPWQPSASPCSTISSNGKILQGLPDIDSDDLCLPEFEIQPESPLPEKSQVFMEEKLIIKKRKNHVPKPPLVSSPKFRKFLIDNKAKRRKKRI